MPTSTLSPSPTTARQTKKRPALSIIIPTLNEEGFIEQLLRDILLQDEDYEVIVSDSGSIDNTEMIVRNYIRRSPHKDIKFIRAPRKGVSMARNNGADNSRGDYIVFLDADTRIPPHFFTNVIREMQERSLDAGGCYLKPDSDKLVDRTLFYLHHHLVLTPLQYTKRPCSAGAGIVVKKEIHNKICGFNNDFKYCEDLDYLKRISDAGIFRMLKSTSIVFSTRRFDEEGRVKVWFKYGISGLCYLLNLKTVEFEYEFGKFSKGIRRPKATKRA